MLVRVSALFVAVAAVLLVAPACPAPATPPVTATNQVSPGKMEESKVQDWSKFIDSSKAAKVPSRFASEVCVHVRRRQIPVG
jgi:invasion protein IalB